MANVTVLNTDASLSSKTLVNAEDAQTISGVKTFSNGLVLGSSQAVHPNTSDGADNQVVYIAGGGAIGVGRGANLYVAGNEASGAGAGFCVISLGNVSGATFIVDSGSGQRLIDANGTTNVVTLSAGKLGFPATQSASSDVNVLDDYEEGTWTPTITGTGGGSGQAYSLNGGTYIKIGKFVFINGRITLSTLGTVTTQAAIGGLPFTSQNVASLEGTLHIGYWNNTTASFVYMSGTIPPNGTLVYLYGATAAATGLSAVVQGNLSNTSDFVFTGYYTASA